MTPNFASHKLPNARAGRTADRTIPLDPDLEAPFWEIHDAIKRERVRKAEMRVIFFWLAFLTGAVVYWNILDKLIG